MKMSQVTCLDPRLRRIFSTKDRPARLRNDFARSVVAGDSDAVQPDRVTKSVLVQLSGDRLPDGFDDANWSRVVDRIYVSEILVSRLEELAAAPEVQLVEAGRELSPALSTSVPETKADQVHPTNGQGFDGKGVLVGIIDFGLDFTLDDFRNPDGTTRVAALWDQWLSPNPGETSPENFPFGVEYDADAINAALDTNDPFELVRHRPEAGSHGTHVASTAAGNGRSGDEEFPAGRYVGTAPNSTIIFVQPAASDQTTTFTDSVRVAQAVAYIFEKADALNMPCVINMSLGQNGGSHDGESVVERAIDRLLEMPGRAFVVAAGNEHVWRGHASGWLGAGETRALQWKVGGELELPSGVTLPPGFRDFTPNEMEIWYSSRDRLRVRVLDPQGNETDWVEPGETLLDDNNGDEVFIDSERFTVLNGDARIYIEVSPSQGSRSLETGVWEVEIEAVESRNGRFDAWVERDMRRSSNRFADQSFFVGTDFDKIMTLGTPSTIRRGLAVANYDHVAVAPSDSSGRGPTRDQRGKPDVAAPGTNIFAANSLGGRRAADGTVEPMRLPMSGTSMSAPHVAGIVALMLQKNSRRTAEQIGAILAASASPPQGVTAYDVAWGFGRVDAEAAVALVSDGPPIA